MEQLSKIEIVRNIIADVDQELEDEEIIHLVLAKTVSRNSESDQGAQATLGQRAADGIAKRVGSWSFVCGFLVVLALWIGVNIVLVSRSFDPYPFILLNLVLSCVAAIQAPLIMMSQNRQEEKDRRHAENDYMVNLKTEIIIQDIHDKLDQLLANQEVLLGNSGAAAEAPQC